jgi:hypothetical protein
LRVTQKVEQQYYMIGLKNNPFEMRKHIETTIGEAEKLFPKKIPATRFEWFSL